MDDNDATAVAIIGMTARVPDAPDLAAFWANLRAGVESIRRYSDDELLAAGVDAAHLGKSDYVKAGAMLAGIDLFDATFFGMTPREAEITDPQQRLFLEAAWEALEHAGYAPGTFKGSIGVYAGASVNRYIFENLYRNPEVFQACSMMQLVVANQLDFLCSRVAYHLNLRGPSVVVQTACSSSLAAVHTACQSILNGECDMALAGGVSISSLKKQGYWHADGDIASPDGHCRAFDADAAGTVFGDGLGLVVLKSLDQARADGDTIYAVIRGSALNNDGLDKIGFTAPSVSGQSAVIREALLMAGVAAGSISYVEAHGTGTVLGDPIEVKALQQAYGADTEEKQFCAIGSVKTNIGHLDAAAGVIGLIKTVLALQHQELPPSLHYRRPNPHVDFDRSAFYVNASLRPWPACPAPRRAGVSSFGMGGCNVHMIVEEAPSAPPSAPASGHHVLVLSAKTPAALDAAIRKLGQFLADHPDVNLADVAFTLQLGRQHFACRRALVCDSGDAAAALLAATPPAPVLAGQAPPVVFLFPGQGAQYVDMALALYRSEPAFRATVDRCAALLRAPLGLDLRDLLFPQPAQAEQAALRLGQTEFTQPALFVVEYALARLLQSWGIEPAAMAGHSLGEYVAACLAGVFTLDDALHVVVQRGKLIAGLPAGRMLAVHASEQTLLPLLDGQLWIAAVNGPALCSVSGTPDAIDALARRLHAGGIETEALATSHAFHSGLMDPILGAFGEVLAAVPMAPPRMRYLSNVTGTWIDAGQATSARYWVDHLRQSVRFSACMATLDQIPGALLLEVGPGRALCGLAAQQPGGAARTALSTLPGARSRRQAMPTLLEALAGLWSHGVAIDWRALHGDAARRRIALPGYPFERQRHWVVPASGDARALAASATVSTPVASRKRSDIASWFYAPSWQRAVGALPAQTLPATVPHLVFADAGQAAEALLDELRRRGHALTLVRHGAAFSAAPGACTIDSTDPAHYRQLMAALRSQGALPARLTDLRGMAAADAGRPHSHFHSLLFLAQACGELAEVAELPMSDPIALTVVSSGVHAVTGDEALSPEKAVVLGPCRVIPLEYAGIACRHVDVALDAAGVLPPAQVRRLADEIDAPVSETVLALRGQHRWTQQFLPVRLPAAPAAPAVREQGHYLITGGMGGIGLTFARYLAASGHGVHLTLIGRSARPARVEALLALEQAGARVTYLAADVSDEAALTGALAQAVGLYGPVNGVFHAAGVPSGTIMERATRDSTARVLDAKVTGTVLLGRLCQSPQLDFMLLCSSVAAIAPNLGQADYCAANAFLDAYAQQRRLSGAAPVVAVNWNAWQEVGMAAAMEVPAHLQARQQAYLAEAIAPADAPAVFDALLGQPLAQVIVSPLELATMLQEQAMLNRELRAPGGLLTQQRGTLGQRPALGYPCVAPRNDIEHALLAIWEELFGMAGIGVDDDFFDLGGHSLLAIQVMAKVRAAFLVDLPLRTLFEHPTIATLAEKIESVIREAIEQMSDEQAMTVADSLVS